MPLVINHKSRCTQCGWEGYSAADRVERVLQGLWALGVLGVCVYGAWADTGFDSLHWLWPVAVGFVVATLFVPHLMRRRERCGVCKHQGLTQVRA